MVFVVSPGETHEEKEAHHQELLFGLLCVVVASFVLHVVVRRYDQIPVVVVLVACE